MTTTHDVPMPEPDRGTILVGREEVSLGHSDEAMHAYADARCAKLQEELAIREDMGKRAMEGIAFAHKFNEAMGNEMRAAGCVLDTEAMKVRNERAEKAEAERDALAGKVKAMEAERDEADRRAGAAERWLAREKESSLARSEWLSKAKRQAGYDDRVSFDDVWAEALSAMKVSRGAPTDCDTGVVLKPREIWALCHGSRREGNRGGVALYCSSEAEARHEATASDYPKVAVCFREVFCSDDFKAAGDAAIDAATGDGDADT